MEEFNAIGGGSVWGLGAATGERDAEDWGGVGQERCRGGERDL